MSEAEWLAGTDPLPLLAFMRNKTNDRRLRLFAVECCRPLMPALDSRGLWALEVAERYADGACGTDELEAARIGADQAFIEFDDRDGQESAANAVECLCHLDLIAVVAELTREAAGVVAFRQPRPLVRATRRLVIGRQAGLVREVYGNPFHTVSIRPEWRTPSVLAIADGIYVDRAFDRLPVLADALEDAGCDHAELLAHCRGPGPHVRGCWAVDRVLDKPDEPTPQQDAG